jgi:hypothetical protein
MLQAIRQLWSGSGPVEFQSAYDLDESVRRLRAATRRWGLFLPDEAAAGRVTASRVSLQRVIPMFGNTFKPFFVGRFERRGGKVVLAGRFTMHVFFKCFMAVWTAGVAAVTVGGSMAAMHTHRAAPMPLLGLGMLLFAVVLMRLGAWMSRNDPAWLSGVIRHALNSPGTVADAGTLPFAGHFVRSSAVITKVAAVMAVLALMMGVSAITGIQAYRAGPHGTVITHYHDMASRYLAGMLGAALLMLACGIYRRRMLAWRLAFVVIGGAWIASLVRFFLGDMPPAPLIVPALAGVFSAFVMIAWGRWWYMQRVHFRQE